MKKTLIALAAVAATSAAFAQSSVTLYGVADLSLGDSNAPGTDIRMNGNALMNNGSSRLGVRGVEDLGGGLKAAFNFEQGLNATTGATDTFQVAGVNTATTTFQRAAWLSLSGGFGSVKLGRTLTPSFFGVAAWELTGTANYSAVSNQFGFAGAGSRNNAELSYTTPSFGGLTATLGTVLEGNTGAINASGQTTQGNAAKYDMNVIYRGGPLTAALSYNTVDNGPEGATLGAKYDFGGFMVAGSVTSAENAAGTTTREGFSIGAGAKLGPVNLVVDIARDTEFKDTDVLLEAKYPLSKRTFIYAAFLRDGNGKTATTVNNYGIGVRHNF
jgi:predicted porin